MVIKIQNGLAFLVPAYRVFFGKEALNQCLSVLGYPVCFKQYW